MKGQNEIQVPDYLLYRRNCHKASQNYLCYLTSTTSITVMKLQKPSFSYRLEIPLEPLRSLEIIQDKNDVYVAAALISRLLVFKNQEIFYENTIKLECNIVHFVGGYASVCKALIEESPAFVFTTVEGEITICNIRDKSRQLKSPQKRPIDHFVSMAVNFPHIYFGDSRGVITCHKISITQQRYQKIGQYNTESNLPILNIQLAPKFATIISSTCYGQLVLLSPNLSEVSIVSAHHSNISKIVYSQQKNILYSFGDDGAIKAFKLLDTRTIEPINSFNPGQLVSLAFRYKGDVYYGLYEQKNLTKI